MDTPKIESKRKLARLKPDKSDPTFSRMVARDGSIWPRYDTGYRQGQ